MAKRKVRRPTEDKALSGIARRARSMKVSEDALLRAYRHLIDAQLEPTRERLRSLARQYDQARILEEVTGW